MSFRSATNFTTHLFNLLLKIKKTVCRRENIASQKDFAKSRLRAELATANNSSEAGQQVLLETDPQVLKAIEALPEAKKYLERNLANK